MEFAEFKKLNLGCGKDIRNGYVNFDTYQYGRVDVIGNIEDPLPFQNDYFEEIYCSHVLEHISITKINNVLTECYRILKKDGVFEIIVPDLKDACERFLKNNCKYDEYYDYIFGDQSQPGQQIHKSGFTIEKIKTELLKAHFQIVDVTVMPNQFNNCIKIYAKK